MLFYLLFIQCLFCTNIFVSHSFIITSFKIKDSFNSSIFLFCFFLAKIQASVSSTWIFHKYNLGSCYIVCDALKLSFEQYINKIRLILHRQTACILMGNNCAPLDADLNLYSYE